MFLSDLSCLVRASKLFCVLTAYMDESYNPHTMCVGGWLCSDEQWKILEQQWAERMQYENRLSAKQGLKPLTRYHASDCANLKGEFTGWTKGRQVRFIKKLVKIIAQHKPVGLAIGARLADYIPVSPGREKERRRKCYKVCMMLCLIEIGRTMRDAYPGERVTVINDRGMFTSTAQSAFESMKADREYADGHFFVTTAPMGWKDCIALQPADLIAYEGYKLCDAQMRGDFDIRRSLRAIVGNGVPLKAGFLKPSAFALMEEMRWEEIRAKTLPYDAG